MQNSLFTEIMPKASEAVCGGFIVANFDTSSYAARVGTGAVFGGGVTAAVIDSAFQASVSTRQPVLIGYKFSFTATFDNMGIVSVYPPGSTVPLDVAGFFGEGTPVYG